VLAQSFRSETKELVVTDGEAVICLARQKDENSLAPCVSKWIFASCYICHMLLNMTIVGFKFEP